MVIYNTAYIRLSRTEKKAAIEGANFSTGLEEMSLKVPLYWYRVDQI